MRPYALFYIYRNRLRVQAGQELLAGLGVTIAVALVFATLVANQSIAGGAGRVIHKVVGPADLQLRALGPQGFSEHLLGEVERLPGVMKAAPVLEEPATIVGPHGRTLNVNLVGGDVSLAILDGLAHTLPGAVFSERAVGLSSASAAALHISGADLETASPKEVSVKVHGSDYRLRVSAIVGPEAGGALSEALVAAMPLESLQALTGMNGRISRILVESRRGHASLVRGGLERIAAGRIAVAPATQDLALLRQALRPSDQASALFAVIAALLGFLFAFNAFLLSVPERRLAIADLRIDGTRRPAIVQMVIFEALALGLVASLVGLALGYVLATGVFHQSAGYLAEAFVLGNSTVIGLQPLILATATGLLATFAASSVLLADLRRGRAVDSVYFEDGAPGNALGAGIQRRLFAIAVALVVAASVLFVFVPSAALIACAMLAIATVLAVPLVLAFVLVVGEAVASRRPSLTALPLAVTSLRATALRSLALAATGSIALFGSVALGGAREDLLRGVGRVVADLRRADIWVQNPGNDHATVTFPASNDVAQIARLTGVAGAESFQGQFINVERRHVWLIARPPEASRGLLETQTIDGNLRTSLARLRQGGWIVVAKQLADEHGARLGSSLVLSTPTGLVHFRIAATTSNLGWPPGAIIMSSSDYARYWGSREPTEIAVRVAPGANVASVRRAISAMLGPGLEVITSPRREARVNASAREGLGQLGEISTLLVLAAILAMAAALGSTIWRQRPALSALRLEGTRPRRLRRLLLVEATLMLGAGCLTGVVAGIYGQVIIDGYLTQTTGFPVVIVAAGWRPLEVLAVVIAAVALIIAVPAWSASRVSPALALEDE